MITRKLLSHFKGFSSLKSPTPGLTKTLQFHFRLLVTISHEDIFTALMSIIHGMSTPCTSAKKYYVPNRKTLEVSTTLEPTQEQWDTPLVESYNKQHIFRWVRNRLNLPSVQGHGYTEWDLREACEIRALIKSSYYEIIDQFGAPKSTLTRPLNVIFLPLKCSSLKHPWYLMGVGKITTRIVR